MSKYGAGKDVSVVEFIRGHLTHQVPKPEGDLTGRTGLVTGATAGLGYATAQHLARLNVSTLVLPVRSLKKGEQYVQQLHKDVPTFRGDVKLLELDLNRFETIPAFVKQLERTVDRLDFAILNAGCTRVKYTKTPDGYEETTQVNVLATGLLAVLLLPLLGKTAKLPKPANALGSEMKPQLEIVASEVHYWVKPVNLPKSDNFIAELNTEDYFNKLPFGEMYNISKLLDVFLARKIASLAAAKDVQVTVTNPGLCKSGFRDDFGAVVAWLMNAISWRAEFGSRTFVHAILEPHPSGSFVSAGKVTPPSTFSCSEEGIKVEDKFWTELVELYGKLAPETKAILSG
ncbi:hypothetical protein JCM10908_003447 [Rhodotorula pacifica]|uniref:uncharacterized protein n=1 Tax=Rhodotorula pacifica TaxID=1495444 RepID=UPI0031802487